MTWLDEYLRKRVRVDGAETTERVILDLVAGAGVTLTPEDDEIEGVTRVTIVSGATVGASSWKEPVRAAATSALPAYTRIGNVITADANGALPAQDGVTLDVGDRLLLAIGTSIDNGLWTVTTVGDGSTPFVLTRATDADSSAEVTAGMCVRVNEGTDLADSAFRLVTDGDITLNTTTLTFTRDEVLPETGATGQTVTYDGSKWIASALNLATAAAVTGILGVANGGTGLSALGSAYEVPRVNAAGTALEYAAIGAESLAPGGANTVLQGGVSSNTWTATPTVTSATATSHVAIGANAAQAGSVRLPHGGTIYGRDSTNTFDRALVQWGTPVTDRYYFGSNDVAIGYFAAASSITLLVNGASILSAGTSYPIIETASMRWRTTGLLQPIDSATAGYGVVIAAGGSITASQPGGYLDLKGGTAGSGGVHGMVRVYNGPTQVAQFDGTQLALFVPNITWAGTVSTPKVYQGDAAASTHGQTLTVRAQNAVTAAYNGGAVSVEGGAPGAGGLYGSATIKSNTTSLQVQGAGVIYAAVSGGTRFAVTTSEFAVYTATFDFGAAVTNPIFKHTESTGATTDMTILAQSTSSGAGANLKLWGGSGTTTNGNVQIGYGATTVAQFGADLSYVKVGTANVITSDAATLTVGSASQTNITEIISGASGGVSRIKLQPGGSGNFAAHFGYTVAPAAWGAFYMLASATAPSATNHLLVTNGESVNFNAPLSTGAVNFLLGNSAVVLSMGTSAGHAKLNGTLNVFDATTATLTIGSTSYTGLTTINSGGTGLVLYSSTVPVVRGYGTGVVILGSEFKGYSGVAYIAATSGKLSIETQTVAPLFTQETPGSDAATNAFTIWAQSALAAATVNTSGGALNLRSGNDATIADSLQGWVNVEIGTATNYAARFSPATATAYASASDGDVLTKSAANGSTWAKLAAASVAPGTDGTVLVTTGGAAAWSDSPVVANISAVQTGTADQRGIQSYQHNDAGTSVSLSGWKSRGTAAAPTDVVDGDYLTKLGSFAYAGGQYNVAGFISFYVADPTPTTNDVGTGIKVNLDAGGGYGRTDRLVVSPTAGVFTWNFQNGIVKTTGAFETGAAPATAGAIRLTEGESIQVWSGGANQTLVDTSLMGSGIINFGDAGYYVNINSGGGVYLQGSAIVLRTTAGGETFSLNMGSGAVTLSNTTYSYTFAQSAHATTPHALTFQAQNVTTGTGSNFVIKSGTGSVAAGDVLIYVGSTAAFWIAGSAPASSLYLSVNGADFALPIRRSGAADLLVQNASTGGASYGTRIQGYNGGAWQTGVRVQNVASGSVSVHLGETSGSNIYTHGATAAGGGAGIISLGSATTAVSTSAANQATLYNAAGRVVVQGHDGVELWQGTSTFFKLTGSNIYLCGSGTVGTSASGTVLVADATAGPSGAPTGGFHLWSTSGEPAWLTDAGDGIQWTMAATTSASAGTYAVPATAKKFITIVHNGDTVKLAAYNA